jgi:RimJ/RimL family protein N-acetyltransferase
MTKEGIVQETDHLLLRRFTEADVDHLVELDSDPEVMRFLTNGRPTPREVIERETLPRILSDYERLRGLGRMAAIERSTDAFLGWIGIDPPEDGRPDDQVELGYRLRRFAWGRGYATEGSRALIRRAFDGCGVRRVFAQTMAVNLDSRRVMEKSGLGRSMERWSTRWTEPTQPAKHELGTRPAVRSSAGSTPLTRPPDRRARTAIASCRARGCRRGEGAGTSAVMKSRQLTLSVILATVAFGTRTWS